MPLDALDRIRENRHQQVMEHSHTHEKDAAHTDGYLAQLGHFYETVQLTSPLVVSGKVLPAKAEAIRSMPEADRLTHAAALYEAERERLGRRVATLRKRIDQLTNPTMRRVPRG